MILNDESKETLVSVLKHAAAQPRTVLEFQAHGEGADTEVRVLDITEHVAALEEIAEEYERGSPPPGVDD